MHVEVFGNAYAARPSGAARPALWHRNVWHRAMQRVRTFEVTYELDEHLARDIGAKTYTVPVFPAAQQGEWK